MVLGVSSIIWYLLYAIYRALSAPYDYWFHKKQGMRPSHTTTSTASPGDVWPSKLKPALAYTYHSQQNTWIPYEPKVSLGRQAQPLKVGTFNVMYNGIWITDYVSATELRWKSQLETIFPQEDFDILCLNEVAVPYLRLLLAQPWLRANYYVSDIDHQYLNPRGNLIIWKKHLSVLGLFREKGMCPREGIVLTVATSPSTFANFVCLHLSAIIDRHHIRRRELLSAVQGVTKFARRFTKESRKLFSGSVYLGDLNFHTEAEGEFAEEVHLIDGWKIANRGKHGYTLDSAANGMLKYLHPSSSAQMRLDRVYLQLPNTVFEGANAPSSCIRLSKLAFFANERIQADPPFNYIWPSDHFGYKMVVSLTEL